MSRSDERREDEPIDETREYLGESAPSRSQASDLTRTVPADASESGHRARAEAAEFPDRIGRYEVVREIARGGVGVVLEAHDEDLGRSIALKVLLHCHKDDPRMRERLVDEAQISGQLEHPGVVPVHEIGLLGGDRPFLTMKLVRGRTLADLLDERESPSHDRQRFLDVFAKVCQAVAYAHSRGVVHRDLKPLNLMVGAFGEVQVMDWGLAKVLVSGDRDDGVASVQPEPGSAPTSKEADGASARESHKQIQRPTSVRVSDHARRSMQGSVLGTPAYMAPEQARGELKSLDERCDVFGLGAILCEILTGAPPYDGATVSELLDQARRGDLSRALTRLDACGADPGVIEIARRCLAVEAADRPADGVAVADLIASHLSSLEARARSAELEAAQAKARAASERKARHRGIAIATMLIVAIFVVGFAVRDAELKRREQIRDGEQKLTAALERASLIYDQAQASSSTVPAAWRTVVESVRRAEGLLFEDAAAALVGRVAELKQAAALGLQNAGWLERLEAIRSESEDSYDLDFQSRSYAQLFGEILGGDLIGGEVGVDAAAERLIATGVAPALSRYLDDWARNRQTVSSPDDRSHLVILELAKAADAHPFRTRLRDAVLADDLDQLRQLATAVELESLAIADLDLIATRLLSAGDRELARRIWMLAKARSPSDFWVNVGLAAVELSPPRPRPGEALRWLSAAQTVRPNSGVVVNLMARILRGRGSNLEARRIIEAAVARSPESPTLYSTLSSQLAIDGELDDAERYARRAIELRGDDGDRMMLSDELGSLAMILRIKGETEEAIQLLERALELFPKNDVTLGRLAIVLMQAGRHDEAFAMFRRALAADRSARNLHAYGMALMKTGATADGQTVLAEAVRVAPGNVTYLKDYALMARPAESLEPLVQVLKVEPDNFSLAELLFERVAALKVLDRQRAAAVYAGLGELSSKRAVVVDAVRLMAWCRAPERASLGAALAEAQASFRKDRRFVLLLPRILLAAGEYQEALAVAASWPEGLAAAEAGAVSLPLMTAAASFSDRVPGEAEVQAVAALLGIVAGAEREACLRHFVAHVAMRQRDFEQAITLFAAGLQATTAGLETWYGLREALIERYGEEEGLARLKKFFDQQDVEPTLRANLMRRGADRVSTSVPQNLVPMAGAVVASGPVTLGATPATFGDSRLQHAHSLWQLRAQGAAYLRTPTLLAASNVDLTALELPAGLLLSNTTYRWQVDYFSAGGTVRAQSEETSFRTGDLGYEPVSFDLSGLCNQDVVADPGDSENGAFDTDGALLIADGFNGFESGDERARGLPPDRRVGVHRLAAYDGHNALQLSMDTADSPDLVLDVPRREYVALRFLVSGGNGAAELSVRMEFADGDPAQRKLICDDWFEDPQPRGRLVAGLTPIYDGMDRLSKGALEDANDAALHEYLVKLPADRELVRLVFQPASASFEAPNTRLNLLAVTGMARSR